jgi:type I restriction enzyme S subunit
MELKRGYKQTEVGVIPEEWEVGYIRDSFDVRNQLRLPISQSVRARMVGPYPYYGPTSVQGWINEYRVEGEYALIGEDGDHFLKWRNQPMTLLVRGKFNVNNHAHLVQGTKNLTEWFYWFFANRDITSHLTRQGAGRYKLTKAALLQLPCALPSRLEQGAIAGALSDVDALICALDQLIAKKRGLKQAAMQQLLTGHRRLPGFTSEWEASTLDHAAEIQAGINKSVSEMGRGALYVTVQDLYDETSIRTQRLGRIRLSPQEVQAKSLRVGDIVIGKSSVKRDGIGFPSQFLGCGEPVVFSGFTYRVRARQGIADATFLFYALRSNKTRQWVIDNSQASALTNINRSIANAIPIALPPVAEQSEIAAVLRDMDAELAALGQRLAKTRALKQSMMQELLTGRTRLV